MLKILSFVDLHKTENSLVRPLLHIQNTILRTMGLKTQLQHKTYALREDTPVESAVKQEWEETNSLLQNLAGNNEVDLHIPECVPRVRQ